MDRSGSNFEILNHQAYNDWAERYIKLRNRQERAKNNGLREGIISLLSFVGSVGFVATGKDTEAYIMMGASYGLYTLN